MRHQTWKRQGMPSGVTRVLFAEGHSGCPDFSGAALKGKILSCLYADVIIFSNGASTSWTTRTTFNSRCLLYRYVSGETMRHRARATPSPTAIQDLSLSSSILIYNGIHHQHLLTAREVLSSVPLVQSLSSPHTRPAPSPTRERAHIHMVYLLHAQTHIHTHNMQ